MEDQSPSAAVLTLRVIIADDDPLARRVVKDALQAADVTVIAEACNGREAAELAIHYRPDCVLMDIVMPEVDGLEAARRIMQRAPEVRVVFLTASEADGIGLVGLRTGACGFLSKDLDIAALPRTLHGAIAGQAAISRELTLQLIEIYRNTRDDGLGMRPVHSALTSREWEVLDLLCAHRGTDEIADVLVLSPETVRSHVKNLLRKLGVRTRADAVAEAQRLRRNGSAVDPNLSMARGSEAGGAVRSAERLPRNGTR